MLCLIAVVAAWLKGGPVERMGATALLLVFVISVVAHPIRMWNVHIGDAALDVGLMLFFGWLAFSRDRWWPLPMTAVMALTVMVHVAMFLIPTLGHYADISARIGLGILMALTLLAGVGERWLAGETGVADAARRRRQRIAS